MKPLNRRTVLSALMLAGLAACSAEKPAFKGIDITGAEYARELALPDTSGKPRTLADFKGKVAVVFFGYTQCPDVCPTTLTEIADVKQKLGADGDKVQAVFVSVDPEHSYDIVEPPQLLDGISSGIETSVPSIEIWFVIV